MVLEPTYPVGVTAPHASAAPSSPKKRRRAAAAPQTATSASAPTESLPLLGAAPTPAPADLAPKAKRPINRSKKGTQVELTAIKILEAEAYKVHRCVRTGVKRGPFYFSQSNDIFGCIDLVAKKKGERTRWIQVTADSGIGRKKQELSEVPWDPLFDSVEIWRWVGGALRKSKSTGAWLDRQYFQVYHLDQDYALHADRRIHIQLPSPTPGGVAS